MRGYKSDVSATHQIIKYLLISKLGIQPSEIEKMKMNDINKLLIIHSEVMKIEKESQE